VVVDHNVMLNSIQHPSPDSLAVLWVTMAILHIPCHLSDLPLSLLMLVPGQDSGERSCGGRSCGRAKLREGEAPAEPCIYTKTKLREGESPAEPCIYAGTAARREPRPPILTCLLH